MRTAQVDELKEAEAAWRARGEGAQEQALEVRAAHERALREIERLKGVLQETDERLRVTLKVNERVRHESGDEHARMLEMQAKLETLQEHHDALMRQNRVLTSLEGLAISGSA